MPRKTRAKLTVEIEYNDHGVTREDIYRVLHFGMNYLAGQGMLSPVDADIETWSLKVEVTPDERA